MKRLWFILFILISNLNSQQTVAVLDFEALGVSVDEAKALTNRFGSEFLDLSDGKYLILQFHSTMLC